MKVRITNQLNTVDSCLTVANSKAHAPVWTDQAPLAFHSKIVRLQTDYHAVIAKGVLAESAEGGVADAKAAAEIALEHNAYVLARALTVHFKNAQDLTRLAQVDMSRTAIVKLRGTDLITKATTIRDHAVVAQTEPEAAAHGLMPARTNGLTRAIATFTTALGTPRGQIVNRSTLLKEIDTDTAALMELLGDLDDLVLQFDGSEAGKSFIEAWHKARMIIDRVGEMPAKKPTTPVSATAGAN